MKIALLQMTSGIDPAVNAAVLTDAIGEAARAGASMLFTPEMSGLIDRDRERAAVVGGEAPHATDRPSAQAVVLCVLSDVFSAVNVVLNCRARGAAAPPDVAVSVTPRRWKLNTALASVTVNGVSAVTPAASCVHDVGVIVPVPCFHVRCWS